MSWYRWPHGEHIAADRANKRWREWHRHCYEEACQICEAERRFSWAPRESKRRVLEGID